MKSQTDVRLKSTGAILAAGLLCAGIATAGGGIGRPDGIQLCAPPLIIAGADPLTKRDAPPQDVTGLPLIDLAGYQRLVAKYKGKPVLVNFWATWCVPCRTEYPMLVGLAKEYQSKGVVFLGVSYDQQQDLDAEEGFLAMYRPVFPNYRQQPGIDVAAFNRGVDHLWNGELPSTIFYRRNGRLLMQFYGRRPRADFEKAIRSLLADPFGAREPVKTDR
jgi:thiol-disulfide isomerase/thioredoxin